MLPAAFCAGGADRFPGHSKATTSMREVLGQAMRNRPFLVMSGAYFVCKPRRRDATRLPRPRGRLGISQG